MVYKEIFKNLKRNGIGAKVTTFVYPEWVKEVIRSRFPGSNSGYDAQYENKRNVYKVTNEDLAALKFDQDKEVTKKK